MDYQLSFTPEPFSGNTEFEEFETLDMEKYEYTGGSFINNGYLQWEEWQQKRLVFRFKEEKREGGYILLNDASRNIWVLLPGNGGRSYYAYGGDSWWKDLYDVTKVPISSIVPGSTNFRDRAIKLLEPLPPSPQEITSNGPKRQIFTQMTGMTHEMMTDAWAKGKKLTSCNAFTGWFARSMGSKTYLGRFDLETFAKRSWVPASSGRTPKHGDILRFQTFHVGIALDLVDGILHTAEGGQGGPSRGFDAIKRKQNPLDPRKFMGWIDLEGWILGGG